MTKAKTTEATETETTETEAVEKDYVLTPVFRLDYPNLFEARENNKSHKMEFSCCGIFPADADLSELKAAVKAAIEEEWGTDRKKWPRGLKNPLRKAEERITEGEYPKGYDDGMVFFNIKSKYRPQVVGPDMEEIIDPSDVYRGCWVRATVKAYTYEVSGNKGVAFGLQAMQKTGDDESISNRPDVGQMFSQVKPTGKVSDAGDAFGDDGDDADDEFGDDIPF
jgi:hypothetical protein